MIPTKMMKEIPLPIPRSVIRSPSHMMNMELPVQYAKRIVGNRQYGGARQYIPLKVNAAGVMPIIFAQAIMFIPMTLAGFQGGSNGFVQAFTDIN